MSYISNPIAASKDAASDAITEIRRELSNPDMSSEALNDSVQRISKLEGEVHIYDRVIRQMSNDVPAPKIQEGLIRILLEGADDAGPVAATTSSELTSMEFARLSRTSSTTSRGVSSDQDKEAQDQ
jgi:hypothetical protein